MPRGWDGFDTAHSLCSRIGSTNVFADPVTGSGQSGVGKDAQPSCDVGDGEPDGFTVTHENFSPMESRV